MTQARPRRRRGCLRSASVLVILIGAAYGLWRGFAVRRFTVPAGMTDMLPALRPGDRAALDRLSYRVTPPHRGDMVAVRVPESDLGFDIRRIVALPGETVEIKAGVLTVNGARTAESSAHGELEGDFGPQRMPQDSYLVLPDDRTGYSASAANSVVVRRDVLGRVIATGG